MREPIPPCKDCNKRTIGCHSNCQDYIIFQQDHAAYIKHIHDIRSQDWAMDEVEKKRFEKYQKAKTRHDKEGAYN